MVAADDGDTVGEDVPDTVDVEVAVMGGLPETGGVVDGEGKHVGARATAYAGSTTPRNTVLTGATARMDDVSVAVLNWYSLVGELEYSINTPPHSARPTREIMAVLASSSMLAEGVARVQVPPTWL